MISEEEIKKRIEYLKGYISGLQNSILPSDKNIKIAQQEIYALEWVLDEGKQ